MYSNIAGFRLVEVIQSAPFHTVYSAHHFARQDRMVAIRMPRFIRERNTSLNESLQEFRHLASVDHPGIIPVFLSGLVGDLAYCASEFDIGTTLLDNLATGLPGLKNAVELVRSLAQTLDEVRRAFGLVHGDINPANIILSGARSVVRFDQPRLLTLCFVHANKVGIAMQIEQPVEKATPFMSPEQTSSDLHWLDARSDIYNLGALLHYLITGEISPDRHIPPTRLDPTRQTQKIVSTHIDMELFKRLVPIIASATSHDNTARQQTTGALATELANLIG